MVKGTNRRVIVVRSPDPKLFEEAIFVLREDAAMPQDAGRVLEEARRAAGDYLKSCGAGKKRRRKGPLVFALVLVLLLALAWAGAWYLGLVP